jgi:hypothetical protein
VTITLLILFEALLRCWRSVHMHNTFISSFPDAALLLCRGVWGPHLVVVPTSVMLNWEVCACLSLSLPDSMSWGLLIFVMCCSAVKA